NLSYNNSILLDPKKFNSITENYKKCLVLGIYNADVFYVLNYNQGSDVLNYYKSIYQLSKNIGIEGIMNEGLKQRMDKNLSNKDSLTKIMEDIYIQSDSYLKNNKRLYDFTLIITGAWLEGVYLNCKLSKGAPDNRVKDLSYKHVWEQRFHLGNLINVLKDFSAQNKEIEPILNNLISLHNKINSIPDYKKMDSKLFEDISSEVFKIRELILS
ncbi:MAG: hypothetical protein N2203_06880, partial [Bacteroidia bacterium]|nr:hypothetical protein [Bacteroidia bacterium]